MNVSVSSVKLVAQNVAKLNQVEILCQEAIKPVTDKTVPFKSQMVTYRDLGELFFLASFILGITR